MAHFFESSNETIIQKVERKKKSEKKDAILEAIEEFKNELENISTKNLKKFNKKIEQFIKNYQKMKNLSTEQQENFHDFISKIDRKILNRSNEKKIALLVDEVIQSDDDAIPEEESENEERVVVEEKINFNGELVKAMKIEDGTEQRNTIMNILEKVTSRDEINENLINRLLAKIGPVDFLIEFSKKFNFDYAFLDGNFMRENFIETTDREYLLYYKVHKSSYGEAKDYYWNTYDRNIISSLSPYKYKILYVLGRRAMEESDYMTAWDLFSKIRQFFFIGDEILEVDKIYANIFYALDLLLIVQSENLCTDSASGEIFYDFLERFKIYSENQLNLPTDDIQMEIYRCFYEKEIGNEEVSNGIFAEINKKIF